VVRVVLVSQAGEEIPDAPGRDLLTRDTSTFADLATAIDRAFARWDLSHLHEFRLSDGRTIGMADTDEFGDGEDELDETEVTLGSAGLEVGASFEYVFDFGDSWEHRCTVLRDPVDPVAESGIVPAEIIPIFGWGAIPDQYGRTGPDDDDDDLDDEARGG